MYSTLEPLVIPFIMGMGGAAAMMLLWRPVWLVVRCVVVLVSAIPMMIWDLVTDNFTHFNGLLDILFPRPEKPKDDQLLAELTTYVTGLRVRMSNVEEKAAGIVAREPIDRIHLNAHAERLDKLEDIIYNTRKFDTKEEFLQRVPYAPNKTAAAAAGSRPDAPTCW